MGYEKLTLINKKTVINKDLLDHMQNGILDVSNRADMFDVYGLVVVTTPSLMDDILSGNAYFADHNYYMYIGESTDAYLKGAVYKITEE